MHSKLFLAVLAGVLALAADMAQATSVFNTNAFVSPAIIDYFRSPVGDLPGGTVITAQYASLGVLHNGHTTTPPGPSGMSSLSGLPGLEAGSGGTPGLLIRLDFTVLTREVGAFFLMGSPTDSITLNAYGTGNVLLEAVTVAPSHMPLRPGPFGFNEGFVGLIESGPIAYATFNSTSVAYVIDDVHISAVPEPANLMLVGLGGVIWLALRRRWWLGLNAEGERTSIL